MTAHPLGRTHDVEINGFGKSDMDDRATAVAAAQGRVTVPDAHPERGSFFRRISSNSPAWACRGSTFQRPRLHR